MQRFLIILLLITVCSSHSYTQSLTSPAGTAVSQLPGNRAWTNLARATGNANGSTSTSGVLNNGNPNTRVLALTNYNFSALPTGITINGIVATVTRRSTGGTAVDVTIELIKGGVIQTAANYANTTAWPTALTAINYGGTTDLWSNSWTRADLVAANFGIAISATRNGSNTTAAIDAVSITVYYSVVTPIILTSFDVNKSGNGSAVISFTTSSEEKVKWLIIERSPNGQIFSELIRISPKGSTNTVQHYEATDFTPLAGTGYYRLKEIDIDGKSYYYMTRLFIHPTDPSQLRVNIVNGRIQVKIHQPKGEYILSIRNMNGALIKSQNIRMVNVNEQFDFECSSYPPGVYLINLDNGKGMLEMRRIYIAR